MQELNMMEVDEVSGGVPIVVAIVGRAIWQVYGKDIIRLSVTGVGVAAGWLAIGD